RSEIMMDSDPACHVTIVFDRPAVAHPREAIEHFVPPRLVSLLGWADRLIDRYDIASPAFDAEDAVQDTLLTLWQAAKAGKVYSIRTDEEFVKLSRHKLDQEVLDERARQEARKRGGAGASAARAGRAPIILHVDEDFDAVDPRAPSPDEHIIAQEEVERRLEH